MKVDVQCPRPLNPGLTREPSVQGEHAYVLPWARNGVREEAKATQGNTQGKTRLVSLHRSAKSRHLNDRQKVHLLISLLLYL